MGTEQSKEVERMACAVQRWTPTQWALLPNTDAPLTGLTTQRWQRDRKRSFRFQLAVLCPWQVTKPSVTSKTLSSHSVKGIHQWKQMTRETANGSWLEAGFVSTLAFSQTR